MPYTPGRGWTPSRATAASPAPVRTRSGKLSSANRPKSGAERRRTTTRGAREGTLRTVSSGWAPAASSRKTSARFLGGSGGGGVTPLAPPGAMPLGGRHARRRAAALAAARRARLIDAIVLRPASLLILSLLLPAPVAGQTWNDAPVRDLIRRGILLRKSRFAETKLLRCRPRAHGCAL